jgi:hypothetical protein
MRKTYPTQTWGDQVVLSRAPILHIMSRLQRHGSLVRLQLFSPDFPGSNPIYPSFLGSPRIFSESYDMKGYRLDKLN